MKKQNKVIKPNVVGGGIAIPLGNNFYFMRGRKHEQGGIDIGHEWDEDKLEVEGGEVMQMGGKHVKVYSSLPILNGKSPAELVIAGLNPNKVFNAQERFKDINKLNDDGTKKARFGLVKNTNRMDTLGNRILSNNPTAKAVVQLIDPTGITSSNDAYDAVKGFIKDPSITSFGDAAVNVIGAIPGAKYFTGINKARKLVKTANTIGDINTVVSAGSDFVNSEPIRFKLGGTNRQFTINDDGSKKAKFGIKKKLADRIASRVHADGFAGGTRGVSDAINQMILNKDGEPLRRIKEIDDVNTKVNNGESLTEDEELIYRSDLFPKLNMLKQHKDALHLYLGKPQVYDTMEMSPYQGIVSKDKKTYQINNVLSDTFFEDNVLPDYAAWKSGVGGYVKDLGKTAQLYDVPYMNNAGMSEGYDKDKGHYISIFDTWDYNRKIAGKHGDNVGKFIGGKPFDLYHRFYLDEWNDIPEQYRGTKWLPDMVVKPNGYHTKTIDNNDNINFDASSGGFRYGGKKHFTINGNVVNKAGYVPSTGKRKKAVMGTMTKEEFLKQLPNNNVTTVDDNTTIKTNNIIKPDLSSLRSNPKFQSKPYDFSAEMSKTIAKVQEDNIPEGYISKNGVFIPTLDTFKKQEIRKMINESVRRSNERTAPTNINLGRLTQDEIVELNYTLQDPNKKLRIDQRDSIQKQLDDNCKYGYTCATTASSNMPRLKDVTKGEGIGYKDRNFMDWENGVLIDPGYFASNSDFRKNHKEYGYELIDDVNHPNGDKDYKGFVNNLQRGDLVQRWTTDSSGFAPRHLMTHVGNDGGDILFVNDSTGQFTPSAIRKNHKYMLMNPNVGTSAYRFVGDKKDHEIMENIYKEIYGDQKRFGGDKKRNVRKTINHIKNTDFLPEHKLVQYMNIFNNDYSSRSYRDKDRKRARRLFNRTSKQIADKGEDYVYLKRNGELIDKHKRGKEKLPEIELNSTPEVKKSNDVDVVNDNTVKKQTRKEKRLAEKVQKRLTPFNVTEINNNLKKYKARIKPEVKPEDMQEVKVNAETNTDSKNSNHKKWFKDNGSDLISGVAKGGASLASYLINRDMLNDLKYSGQPVFTPAAKLKTKININPQIDAINRTVAARNRVAEESASSKVRNYRMNTNYIDRLGYLNELYGNKENKETELINKDRLNQQEITKGNIQAYNDWAEKKQTFENTIRDKQSENAVSFVTNLATGVDDILSNRLKRKQFDQNIAAYIAGHPNVSTELLGDVGITVVTDRAPEDDKEKTSTTRFGGVRKSKYKYRSYKK